jgi:hypothetical protein
MGVKLSLGLRAFENRVLREVFGPKRGQQEGGRNYKIRRFRIAIRLEMSVSSK